MGSILVFNTLSDPFLRVAFWTGVSAFTVTLVLGMQILVLRLLLRRTERNEKKAIGKWRPVLNAAIAGAVPDNLPILSKLDCIVFFQLWVHLHASLRGSASKELNTLGYRLDCDALARKMLERGTRAEGLLATLALGYLKDRQAWSVLFVNARQTDSTTSFHAVWALVQIDALRALEELTPDVIEREDWPVSQIVTMLEDVRALYQPILLNALPNLSSDHVPRALRIAEGLRIDLPPSIQEKMLGSSSSELVVAALRGISNPALLHTIRTLATHDNWRVRVHVGKALGRIGDSSDVEVLKTLIGDSQWWVRYRAAQALVGSPYFVRQEVDLLIADTDDHLAGDTLRQVMAEQAA